ncbi:hypothetical protein HEP86_13845 [Streptomyces sp. RPA4-5]|uniref:hypothetical protein n=1 Tax=unclassified Streptomyces TaxID=2593676 RepID=UPI00143EDF43|nr:MULTISPECIES: hypothetical protein [unclassified Streptomyces]QIY55420.1 hypothetical protein HEP86_13845 [Streptomyces sp. RPA4-5]WJY38148.1 hypothetical protein QT196_13080 [Streptomyces sp. P9-2B-2]
MSEGSPTPPATPEEALAIVRSHYAEPKLADGSPAPMHVEEFDIGYLVYPEYPDSLDDSGEPQPAPPGGATIIVSKDTGETVTVPNLPTETAIALYRQQRQSRA